MKLNGHKHCIFSVDVDPDTIAFAGRVTLVRDDVPEGMKPMKRVTIDPKWREIADFADESIANLGDHHHVFLEGAVVQQLLPAPTVGLGDQHNIPTLTIQMGS